MTFVYFDIIITSYKTLPILQLMVTRPLSAVGTCLIADPGIANSIPAKSHTFVDIDHEIIPTAILLPSSGFDKGCCQLQAKVCARSTGLLIKACFTTIARSLGRANYRRRQAVWQIADKIA